MTRWNGEYISRERERELIAAAQSGDTAAVAELCEAHKRCVWDLAVRVSKANKHVDIDDLAQQGLLKLIEMIGTFDLTRRTKLLTYARDSVLQQMWRLANRERRNRYPAQVGDVADTRDGDACLDVLIDREQRTRLLAAVALLPVARDRVILRRRSRGETLKTIAGELGISKERVRQLELRALNHVAAIMGEKR